MGAMSYRDPVSGLWVPLPLMGAQGPQGPTGPTGPVGPAGPIGERGPAGTIGPTGSAGLVGATGPTGAAGTPGAVGPTGTAGGVGPKGPAGVAGDTGDTGPVGAAGPAGADHPAQFRVGSVSFDPAANQNSQGPRTLFSSAYGSTPQCVVSMRTSVPGGTWMSLTHTGLDAAGFTPVVWRTNTTTCIVDFMAVGVRAGLLMARMAEVEAAYEDEGRHVYYVQTPSNPQGHEVVEAIDYLILPDGTLQLVSAQGSVVREYGPGEWFSYQREYIWGVV